MFADVGPFRFQATSWNANRFVSLQGKEAPAVENLSLNMTISGASGGAVAIVGWPTVQEAEDDAGQSRLLDRPEGGRAGLRRTHVPASGFDAAPCN